MYCTQIPSTLWVCVYTQLSHYLPIPQFDINMYTKKRPKRKKKHFNKKTIQRYNHFNIKTIYNTIIMTLRWSLFNQLNYYLGHLHIYCVCVYKTCQRCIVFSNIQKKTPEVYLFHVYLLLDSRCLTFVLRGRFIKLNLFVDCFFFALASFRIKRYSYASQ